MIKTVKLNSRGYISAAVLRLISTFNTDAVKDIKIIVDRVVFFVIAANIHYCFSVMHHNQTVTHTYRVFHIMGYHKRCYVILVNKLLC